MSNWDSRYTEGVKLVAEMLPALAAEKLLGVKGGVSMNLSEQDLPLLWADLDLTWFPIGEFARER